MNDQPQPIISQRDEARMLRARYDTGAMPPGAAAQLKRMETNVAWEQHRRKPPKEKNHE